jgi:hypothetical protein
MTAFKNYLWEGTYVQIALHIYTKIVVSAILSLKIVGKKCSSYRVLIYKSFFRNVPFKKINECILGGTSLCILLVCQNIFHL